ncbi:ABC transporter permease [Streptomyces sp. NRRL F-5727]|uniref:ABC transporter permease n=1 Tax=Streptomyces sp. NRRL F-5727 TaxID=1463871 RepID=UPI0004C4981E|nr:ABC transporter permease [Streptomyces sp. NRRL F-5727]
MSTLAPKGPTWVTLRQYRRTLWLAGALALLALAVVAGLRIWAARHPVSPMKDGVWAASPDNDGYLMLRWFLEYVGFAGIALSGLVAAVVAGPMVAREYESGTYQLSLTQSVGPAEWLRSKLTAALVAGVLAALAVMGIFWFGRLGVREGWDYHWSHAGTYAATGVTVFAYVLAAVAFGALVGQLVRRTVPAMAVAALVMGSLIAVFNGYRWSLLPTERETFPLGGRSGLSPDYLHMDSGMLTSSGASFDPSICWKRANATPGSDAEPGLWEKVEKQCYAEHDVTTQFIDYHPSSHFWPTQLIETGIVLTVAALAAYAAFRVLRARHP